MSDTMRVQPFATQLRRILAEYERARSIFGIHESLFYRPEPSEPFAVPSLFGKPLAAPIGPSAGPHTQLSQNIVSAWLCGGRFIELKTVQVKDDLVIPRPCIDMTDEGYNVEWSQELRLEESAHEYVVAWALLHVLPRVLGWEQANTGFVPGVIFDMSVGYTLEGIRDARMTRFMDVMADASEPLEPIRDELRARFPALADLPLPNRIVNSVTLSTMHGCPPGEIEQIARYLMEERRLHVVVKLNPTLLGKQGVRDILHERLGFTEIEVPPSVFDHDLQYTQAIRLITRLQAVAAVRGVTFGVKLSNTLAVGNHAGRLPGGEMYMSGRALYPVTMALYARLQEEFGGTLHVSYSAGADAVNVAGILACGALPVTGCTDLLKPGGYGRLRQWLENLREAMSRQGAANLAQFSRQRTENLRRAAAEALQDTRYRKQPSRHGLPKVPSALGRWDCIVAPCADACPVRQDVPGYAALIARREYDRALQVILARNPLPGVTGYVCTHVCQARCVRNDYEESVAIRALKRVAAERGVQEWEGSSGFPLAAQRPEGSRNSPKVAIIGSGPSGLAAAAFLALNGVEATIFEARDVPGGMMRLVPPFRLPQEVIDRDIERITALGVEIRLRTPITSRPEALLGQGFDAVHVASGFQRDVPLRIPGIDGPGVVSALQLLDWARRSCSTNQKVGATPVQKVGATPAQKVAAARDGSHATAAQSQVLQPPILGRAVVIGGGDTAMDAARTALRLTGQPAVVLYRRTRAEMPASLEELDGALDEGTVLEELVSPLEIIREHGRVTGVRCVRNSLGEPEADGRRRPIPIPESEFFIPCDSVVVAIGQLPELSFLDGSAVWRHRDGGVLVDGRTGSAGPAGVYAGGDVVVEPGSIISACADGLRAAEAICGQLGVEFSRPPSPAPALGAADVIRSKTARARRIGQQKPSRQGTAARRSFALVEDSLSEAAALREAERCVQCSTFCDKCVEVCPNRANYSFTMEPVTWTLPLLRVNGVKVATGGVEEFRVWQDRQILHVDDFCNECDNCQTFCVHQGKPYSDKPRLFLDPGAFEAEAVNAFHVQGATVRRREDGKERRLTVLENALLYQDEDVVVRLTLDWKVETAEAKRAFEGRKSLKDAAEMLMVYRGVTRSLPFLLLQGK